MTVKEIKQLPESHDVMSLPQLIFAYATTEELIDCIEVIHRELEKKIKNGDIK